MARFGKDTPTYDAAELADTLNDVRTALRITSTQLYDPELMIYINSVKEDFENVGITPEAISLSDFTSACIAYAKSMFGNSGVADKSAWSNIYHDQLRKYKLRGDSDAV